MRSPILVIEDDPVAAEYARAGLQKSGRSVDVARDGASAIALVQRGSYSAIILDRMLPKVDGLEVLARIQALGVMTPVIILSAMSAVRERVRGLEHGADDYLVKPFHISELVARIEVLERRSGQRPETDKILTCEDLSLHLIERVVVRGATTLQLHNLEFGILRCLLEHPGEPIARAVLLKEVWNYDFDPGTNIVDVHVSRLRAKLDLTGTPGLIRSVRGVGYAIGHRHHAIRREAR